MIWVSDTHSTYGRPSLKAHIPFFLNCFSVKSTFVPTLTQSDLLEQWALSFVYVVVHLFPSCLVWERNQAYCACCSAQTANKLVLAGSAKRLLSLHIYWEHLLNPLCPCALGGQKLPYRQTITLSGKSYRTFSFDSTKNSFEISWEFWKRLLYCNQ